MVPRSVLINRNFDGSGNCGSVERKQLPPKIDAHINVLLEDTSLDRCENNLALLSLRLPPGLVQRTVNPSPLNLGATLRARCRHYLGMRARPKYPEAGFVPPSIVGHIVVS